MAQGQEMSREQAREKLHHLLRSGAPIPSGLLPDALLLEALIDCAVHPRRSPVLPCLLPFLILPVLLMVCSVSPGGGMFLLFAAPIAYLIWLVVGWGNEDVVVTRALTEIRLTVLPRATTTMVPQLLRLRRRVRDPQNRATIDEALLPLLRDYRTPERLTHLDQSALRGIVHEENHRTPPLATAALLLLGDCSNSTLRRPARRWAKKHPDAHFQAAAEEYLRQIEGQGP